MVTVGDKPAHGGGVLARLARLNVTAVFLLTIGYVLVAFFAPGIVGGALLLALAAGLVALMARTWTLQAPPTRVLRLVVLTLLVAVALYKIL